MPRHTRLAAVVLLAASLCTTGAGAAPSPAGAQAELDAIHKLAETSTDAALHRIVALQASLGDGAPYDLRRQVLRTEVWLREDAGQLGESYAVERKLLALALVHKDRTTAAQARLGEVRQLLANNRTDEAQARLTAVHAELPATAPVTVAAAFDSVQGDIHNLKARFDQALQAYLRALQRLEGVTDAGDQRATLYGQVAQVYINSDHPDKAVETARKGVSESGASAPASASLQLTEGIALVRLGRGDEGIAAFRKALAMAEQAGLDAVEAAIRGNIADYYLRQHDYVRAEQEARQALEVSTRVKVDSLIIMARANLGFALMGQGRMDAGVPHIDAVVAEAHKAGAVGDVEALLDEKGRMLEAAGQYRQALTTVREQQALQLSSARTARDRAIATLQEEFDASQRTRQIALLQRENQLKDAELGSRRKAQFATGFAAVLTVLACAIVYLLYRRAARSNAQLQQLNRQLEYHSMRDALTGLHNRRSFVEKMGARTVRGTQERRVGSPEGVDCFMLMDIDHFKSINDRWGHGVGDAVLVEVARRLTTAVRDTDMVLRWGGEEFLIYAPGTDPAYIDVLAKRVLDAIGAGPVDADSCTVPVTVTAGVVSLPFADAGSDDGADWQRAVRLADWALYQGKAQGRNQARIITRLRAPADTVMTSLDGAAGGAVPDGMVEMACVHGPGKAPS